MNEQTMKILELFSQPAFLVRDERVLWRNAAAQSLVEEGSHLSAFVADYALFFSSWNRETTAQLSVLFAATAYDASVTMQGDDLLFVLSSPSADVKSSAAAVLNASASLRRPLHSLLNASETLFEQIDMSVAKDAAMQVNHAIYQLMRLCTQMSDGSRLLLEQVEPRRRLVSLNRFFDHFISQVSALVTSAGRTLQYTPLPSDLFAQADADLLERALFNLLTNALTYTPQGGTVSISLCAQAKRLLISVSDSGEGISQELLPTLFERYSDRPIGDCRWGFGYGLPMVRQIARLHGGSMVVETNGKNGGTTVAFSISLEHSSHTLRSPQLRLDYCSGMNHALVELSDILGKEHYDPQEI